MERAAELDLPYLTMEEDAFAADPFPRFEAARQKHPWLARWTLGYVITDYAAMREVFRNEDKMRMMYADIVRIMEADGTPWGEFQKRHMLNTMGAEHKRIRDIVAPAFTPRQANLHRPLMREVITNLLDEWAPRQEFDFEEFASYFPISVMCRLIGADPAVVPGLRSAMEAIGLSTSMDRRFLPAMQEGVRTMEKFVDGLIASRRAEDRTGLEPDLLDILLRAQADGGLSDRELADVLIVLFVGGYDTSKNMLTLIMRQLIAQPEIYERCGQDFESVRPVVEEGFRLHGVISSQRVLTQDVACREVVLEKDSIVWFPLTASLHDSRYAENPDDFNPARERKCQHIAFGLGGHICIGQFIARAQIEEGLHLIAKRLKNPRTSGPQGWRPFPGIWGIKGLPVSFELAA